jgi:hypothetical protein
VVQLVTKPGVRHRFFVTIRNQAGGLERELDDERERALLARVKGDRTAKRRVLTDEEFLQLAGREPRS